MPTKTAPLLTRHGTHAWTWTVVISLSVYATSSMHRLAGGDSGELLAEACTGGTAHPPGYPLLLLALRLLRLVGRFLCPDTPFVVLANGLNALFAAGAAASVTHIVELLAGCGHPIEAVAAGLLFALSPLTWEYALGLEVFALNNLLVGLLLVCFVRHVVDCHSMASIYVGALVCGLGLTNQHTIVLLEIPLICYVVATTKLRLRNWIYLTIAFSVGIAPYAYTYFAAKTPTRGSWGDASTLHGLMTHVLRREYGTFQLSPMRSASETLLTRITFYANDVGNELTPVSAMCATLGVATSLATAAPREPARRHLVGMVLVVFTVYLVVFNSLANLPLSDQLPREVTRRFFMQPNMLVTIMAGVGITTLRQHCQRRLFTSAIISPLVTAATIALVAHQYLRSRDPFTTSIVAQHDLLRGFGRSILDDLPLDSILLSYTDVQWNAVRYLQTCEHMRSDVVHLNLQLMAFPWFQRQQPLYPSVVFPPVFPDVSTTRSSQGYATYLARFVQANVHSDRAVFLDLHGVDESTISSEQLLFGHIQVLPHGFVWQIVQASADPQQVVGQWHAYATRRPTRSPVSLLAKCCGLASHTTPTQIPRGSWEFVVVSIAHDAMYQQSLAQLGYWLTHGTIQSVELLEQAVLAFDDIQYQLNELVWAGVQFSGEAITYDLYAVEKNAVVSRQRFQLCLDVLAELYQEAHSVGSATSSKRLQALLAERDARRDVTIAQVETFLVVMEKQGDGDSSALRHGLETMKSKRTLAATTEKSDVTQPQRAKTSSRKHKKRSKKQA